MKNIFLLGDSIRLGYCKFVKENLAEIANVYYPQENCACTQYTMIFLEELWARHVECGAENVDIVHWNNGHWDVRHWDDDSLNTVEEYCKMLKRLYKMIQKFFPKAKIIFATTTPMNPSDDYQPRTRTTQEIMVYNEAAKKTILEMGGEINDLFAYANEFGADKYKDHCHYTEEGFKLLGDKVTEVLKKAMD